MNYCIHSIFSKILVSLVALIIASASFFSMAAMDHGVTGMPSIAAMTHNSGGNNLPQPTSCLNFYLNLMEKFSHGFTGSFASFFLVSILAFTLVLFITKNLFGILRRHARMLKVRLRQCTENVAGIFKEILGNWLSLFEKRDPSYVFATT